jgi:hypothetical protein
MVLLGVAAHRRRTSLHSKWLHFIPPRSFELPTSRPSGGRIGGMVNRFALPLSVVLLAMLVYPLSYVALVEQRPKHHAVKSGNSVTLIRDGMEEDYRFGGDFARFGFWPANQIDRHVRKDMWD